MFYILFIMMIKFISNLLNYYEQILSNAFPEVIEEITWWITSNDIQKLKQPCIPRTNTA